MEACTESYIQLSGGGLTDHHKSVSGCEHQGWCEHPSEINQVNLIPPSSLLFQEFVCSHIYGIMLFDLSFQYDEKLEKYSTVLKFGPKHLTVSEMSHTIYAA